MIELDENTVLPHEVQVKTVTQKPVNTETLRRSTRVSHPPDRYLGLSLNVEDILFLGDTDLPNDLTS